MPGFGKAVVAGPGALVGADAGNYVVQSVTGPGGGPATASIVPAATAPLPSRDALLGAIEGVQAAEAAARAGDAPEAAAKKCVGAEGRQ